VRTGQVAADAGVNVQTLRYYERRGLLPEPPRRDSGYRAYSKDTVAVVRFIKRAQELGFTLGEIDTLLHLAGGGPASCEAVKGLAQEKLLDLDSRMEGLRVMHDSLQRLVDTCDRPARRRECPLIEALGSVPNGDREITA
jgi:MerR family transcriptional regulator, mercuric resistance operon regulatory protein